MRKDNHITYEGEMLEKEMEAYGTGNEGWRVKMINGTGNVLHCQLLSGGKKGSCFATKQHP